MKRSIFIVLLLIVFSGLTAHSPSSFDITYNEDTVLIGITHDVGNTSKHFVDKIEIELDGETIIVQTFDFQSKKEMQEAIYRIGGLEEGDVLNVTAYCNISGKKKIDFVIPAEETDEE